MLGGSRLLSPARYHGPGLAVNASDEKCVNNENLRRLSFFLSELQELKTEKQMNGRGGSFMPFPLTGSCECVLQ